tara:strand:+ start:17 stop:772 length:756 start_codon:yes stop_codon:yes gene_type:complete
MKKILILFFLGIFFTFNVNAESTGQVKDCFEGVNRATFAFNQGLDKAIFKPVSKAYRHLPVPIRKGTGNVVNNLSNLITIPNNIFQGDFLKAGTNVARLTINSTVGILGIFDVATAMGFVDYEKEDYGQTLGVLGVKEGCYLVLPVLGPSTVRDTVGTLTSFIGGDPWYNVTVRNDTQYVKESDYYVSRGTSGVDFRSKNIQSVDNLEENSMDFYASVRSLYLQDRQQKILNSNSVTETQDDSDWDEVEEK